MQMNMVIKSKDCHSGYFLYHFGSFAVSESFYTVFMTLADTKIYISGGELGLGRGRWNTEILMVDTLTRRIYQNLSMPTKLRHHVSCCSRDHLFIYGGYDRYRIRKHETYKINLLTGMTFCDCAVDLF